ncbi:hypothetical protein SAMN05428947_102500 [Mucilaginibacter sp. OK283]|nr:hypothetical protein SAMN05428947_102500 [Mucilaginibacter sp. OK283]
MSNNEAKRITVAELKSIWLVIQMTPNFILAILNFID